MARFPTKQADINAMALNIAMGVWNHAEDFPNIDGLKVVAYMNDYKDARNAQIEKIAALKLATNAKNESLKALTDLMKHYLRKSEVDTATDPLKLSEIGWGPKAEPQPTEPPNQPKDLIVVSQQEGKLILSWDKPDSQTVITNYIIQRRENSGQWQLTATSLKEEITLERQPQATQLEYQVKAVNPAGMSIPSNTIAVVM